MKWLALAFAGWYLWLPVTFFCGRVFCRWVCPLGLSQSLVQLVLHPRTRVRRVCTRLPRSKWQRAVNWLIVAAYFTFPIGAWVHPWGIFGRALFGFVPGAIYFAAVVLSAVFMKGRFWCNWICPLGTIFDLVARLGWREDQVGSACRNCRRCFE